MWLPDRTKLLKILLHNQGEDPETVWAEDLGPGVLDPAARYVRIGNVPMLHAKPTYGDVIEVLPVGDGMLEWDREGVEFDEIGTRILEDGGRWVAIIDYSPSRPTTNLQATFQALDVACAEQDIALEGAITRKLSGCAYLAVPNSMDLAALVHWLESRRASMRFRLRHPEENA